MNSTARRVPRITGLPASAPMLQVTVVPDLPQPVPANELMVVPPGKATVRTTPVALEVWTAFQVVAPEGASMESIVPCFFAVGECSCVSVHGANRLASNSLLEGMVLSTNAAASVRDVPRVRPSQVAPWSKGGATDSNDAIVVALNWDEIRRFMWAYVSIVRTDKRLERARHRIENVRDEIRQYYLDFNVTSDLIELRNVALVAELVIASARQRKESRGLHYTLDHLQKLPEARHSRISLATSATRSTVRRSRGCKHT